MLFSKNQKQGALFTLWEK